MSGFALVTGGETGIGALAIQSDTSDEDATAKLLETVADRRGPVSAFLACRAALPQLIETRGAIVTSLGGLRAAPASAAYASSKAGRIMLTQCIAIDHGPQGVRGVDGGVASFDAASAEFVSG